MPSLFPELEPEPHQLFPFKNRLTAGVCGRGPAGETCKTCAHCVRLKLSSKTVLKCGLMEHHWTRGPGTDIRAAWPACEHWQAPAVEPPQKKCPYCGWENSADAINCVECDRAIDDVAAGPQSSS